MDEDLENAGEEAPVVAARADGVGGKLSKDLHRLVPAAGHRQGIRRLREEEQLRCPVPAATGKNEAVTEGVERLPVSVARETGVREVAVTGRELQGWQIVLQRVPDGVTVESELLLGATERAGEHGFRPEPAGHRLVEP